MKIVTKSERHFQYIILIITTLLGLYVRYIGRDFLSGDFNDCLNAWYLQISSAGPHINALLAYSGDYPMPYAFLIWLLAKIPIPFLYSLKTFNCVVDFFLAIIIGKLVERFNPHNPFSFYIGYGVTLLLPHVFLNSCYWGQCDGLYTVFMFAAILCWSYEKYPLMMLMAGFAFSFKLQSIFILPFLLIVYWFQKKFSFMQFLIIPATMLIMNIPAIIAGYSPAITFTKYMGLASACPWLYYFYPNIWFFFQARPYYLFSTGAIMLAISALLLFVVLLIKKGILITHENALYILLWTAYTCVFLLPSMHERYGFFAELVAVIIALINIRFAWLPLIMMLCTLPKYLYALYLVENPLWLQMTEAIINSALYLVFTILLWKWLFQGKHTRYFTKKQEK